MSVQARNAERNSLLRAGFERGWATYNVVWDPPNMADGAVTSTTIGPIGVTGIRTGDPAVASHDQIGANDVMISAHVQAANTVRVILYNRTGGALDIANGNLVVAVRVRY